MNGKIDEILKSIDGIKKATPKPFLLTRVSARIKVANALPENIWYKIAFYLKKPSVAFAAVILLVLINILFERFSVLIMVLGYLYHTKQKR